MPTKKNIIDQIFTQQSPVSPWRLDKKYKGTQMETGTKEIKRKEQKAEYKPLEEQLKNQSASGILFFSEKNWKLIRIYMIGTD